MQQIIMNPRLHKFDDCKSFVEEFNIGKNDLILASKSTYLKHFASLGLQANVLFRGDFGTGEPTDVMCEAIAQEAAKMDISRIIAIGGGAVIDIAKVLAVSTGGTLDELYAMAPDIPKQKQLVIVPTTCGSGSEMTNISVINRTRIGTKMGLVGPSLYADDAVLIPELLDDLPYTVFATSSIDALVHAVESALSPKATAYTKVFSYQAIEMIVRGYQDMLQNGLDSWHTMQDDFLTASNFAGIAFGTAGCACVHAMAYPLGGLYHVAHGESNYAVFTGVMNAYMQVKTDGEIQRMNQFLAKLLSCEEAEVYHTLEALLDQVLKKKPLREYGVTSEILPELAKSVNTNQQRLLKNSFVPVTEDMIFEIYKTLY